MIEDIKNYRNTLFNSESLGVRDINDEYFDTCLDILKRFSKDLSYCEFCDDLARLKQILSDIECLFDSEKKRHNLLELVKLAKNAYQNYKKHLQDNAKNEPLNEEEQINNEESTEKTETKQQEQSEEENQGAENKEEDNKTINNQKKKPRRNQDKKQENQQNKESKQNEEQNQEEILSDDELDKLEQDLNEFLANLEFLNDNDNVDGKSDDNQEDTKNQQNSNNQATQLNPKKRDLNNFKKQMQDFFNDRGVGGKKDIVKAPHSYMNESIKKSEIKRLCKMICEGFGIGVSKNDKHYLGYELDGITSSDILKNALPSEFALLNDELAENLFFAKFCEKSLSTWLNKPSDKGKISPLIIAIDNSGSMSGAPEMVAKTVGYYLINECKKHKKECILVLATEDGDIKTSKKLGYDELLYTLSKYRASGGYNIDWVLKTSLKKAREYNNKANLLAISDFCIEDIYLKDIEDELNAVKSYALFISFFGGNRFDVVGFHKYFLYDNSNHTINVLERKDKEEKLKKGQR